MHYYSGIMVILAHTAIFYNHELNMASIINKQQKFANRNHESHLDESRVPTIISDI